MTDRKMLELAAKAMASTGDSTFSNYEVLDNCICLQLGSGRGSNVEYWEPNLDNDHSFRLAVALRFRTECTTDGQVYVWLGDRLLWNEFAMNHNDIDQCMAAMRRAVLRGAATIGAEVEPQR